MGAIAELGYTIGDVKVVLVTLEVEDYFSGPKPDHNEDFAGEEIWEFGRDIEGCDHYIKLKLRHLKENIVVCLSFHPSDREINYPFKA